MKRIVLMIALLMLVMASGVSFGQDGAWSVYLFSGTQGELIRVGLDGSQTSYDLDLAENVYLNSFATAFTDDGRLIGFCEVQYPTDPANPTIATLRIRDIAAGTDLHTINLGNPTACDAGRSSFNDSGTLFAFGVINYYPGDPNANTSLPVWQIYVLDVATGEFVNQLEPDIAPAVSDLPFGDLSVIPLVRSISDDGVVFLVAPYGTDFGGPLPAFRWQLDTGAVEPVDRWGETGLEALDTGEVVWQSADANFPAGEPGGPIPQWNVLLQADSVEGESRIIYHNPTELILDANFVSDGQAIAMQLLPSFDPNLQTPPANRWVILDRAGNVTDLFETPYYSQIVGAPGGYLVLLQNVQNQDFANATYTLDYVSGDATTRLWEGTTTNGALWEIAWTTPSVSAADLQAFPTVTP